MTPDNSDTVDAVASGAPKQRPLHEAVHAFVGQLSPAQETKLHFAFDDEERLNWYYVPRARKGLTYLDMDEKQRHAALDLLAHCLSEAGYKKTETIRALENVLAEIEHDTNGAVRNPNRYYFSLFGEPSAKGAWGLRYEGHHISLHWTVIDGKVLSSTPQFLGSNPADVRSGPQKGTRVLGAEEDLGRALARSLTADQQKHGILSQTVPGDIMTTNQRHVMALEDVGIACKDLTAEQRGMLLSLINEYAGVQPEAEAKRRLDAIRKAGLDAIKFAWIGSMAVGEPHYYRVQGPTFLIEYDNTQNHANHAHSAWRDFNGDFGIDVLAAHYKNFPAGSADGHDHGHK